MAARCSAPISESAGTAAGSPAPTCQHGVVSAASCSVPPAVGAGPLRIRDREVDRRPLTTTATGRLRRLSVGQLYAGPPRFAADALRLELNKWRMPPSKNDALKALRETGAAA